MKILYLSDALNVHDAQILDGLRRYGADVVVSTFYQRGPEIPTGITAAAREVFHHRLPVYPDGLNAPALPGIRRLWYAWDEHRALRILRDDIRRADPDLLFAQWTITAGYLAARSGFHPIALFPWGSDVLYLPFRRGGYLARTRAALSAADLIVCNSRTMMRRIPEILGGEPRRMEFLPCELDRTLFHPDLARADLRRKWGAEHARVLISTRPLKELYDVETIIRAVPLLPGDTVLVLVGDGHLRPRLEALAQDMGVAARVRFAGAIPHGEIPGYLNTADLYVSAAVSDCTSLGMLEAMACRRPVAATDIEPNRDWIEPGINGALFRPGDPADLAAKAAEILRDDDRRERMGLAAERRAQEADRDVHFPKMMAAFQGLIG